jgi:hypothetical protein
MKSYSILIIAWNAFVGHVEEFIINLKRTNPLVKISLLTIEPEAETDSIPAGIVENASEIIYFRKPSREFGIKLIDGLMKRFSFFRSFIYLSNQHYDIVNIHFVLPSFSHVMPWIKKVTRHIVISPWGSDVLRIEGDKKIRQLQKVYNDAQFVTVGKESQIGKRLIDVFKVDPDKLVGMGWGGAFFDFIQENSMSVTIEDAKKRFGLSGRYVITCGYNTQKEQRHEAIINAIHGVRGQLPENLTLLFPFTYGRSQWSDTYTMAIKEKAKSLGFDVVSVEENLDMSDLLKLRMATDIFVHVQTTDAGSRCVMEYVACNKKIVHGSWIYYGYLEKYKPSCYFPVDRLENLGACIVRAYQTPIESLPDEVMNIILNRGWKHKMLLWNNFFESLV